MDDLSRGLALNNAGEAIIIGDFSGTVDFDPGIGVSNLTSNGYRDVFIEKLDANGNFVWAKSMGGTLHDYGFSITSDALGNVYVTGYFLETVDFDPGPATFNLTSNGFTDIFILRLDASGNFVWAKSVGGSAHDNGQSITTDASGNVYVTGWYSGSLDFDPDPTTFNLTSIGGSDVFVQKLSQPYLGINENKFLQNLEVFPNPNNGQFKIKLDRPSNGELKVYNTIGSVVYQETIFNQISIQIDLPSSIVDGIYLVQLVSGDRRASQRVVVRKE